MEIEQLEIRDYLSKTPPLDKISSATLNEITLALEINYVQREGIILDYGDVNDTLFLIRTGAVKIVDNHDKLTGEYDSGDWFGYRSLLEKGHVKLKVIATEDCLLYEKGNQIKRKF